MSTSTTELTAPAARADLRSLGRPAHADAPAVPRPHYPWKSRLLLPAALLLATGGLLAYAARAALWPATDVTVVPVVVKPVAAQAGATGPRANAGGGGAAVVQAAGWVEADPYPVAVPALTDGIVRDVLVLEGQTVNAGDVVARLVDDDARLALARAEAELAERQADLTAAQRAWENPVELQRAVATAEAMVAESEAELRRLDSEVAAERARVAELADALERAKQSFTQNAASEQEVVSTRLKLEAQQATLKAVEAQRPVLDAQLRQHQAERTAAADNLRLRIADAQALDAAKAAVALAAAMRDEAKLRLDRTQVRAPVGGVVMQRHVTPGSKLMVAMDDPDSAAAVHLFDPAKLQVRVDVPLADAAKVGVDMPADVVVGVLPERTFKGVVTRVVQEADVSKNTLQVKVAITDPAPELKPEMLARVKFLAAPKNAGPGAADGGPQSLAVFAPRALIEQSGDAAAAWVVNNDSVVERRAVTLGGASQDGWVAVAAGLNAGDRLVADRSRVQPGDRVRVVAESDPAGVATASNDSTSSNGATHGVH